MKGESISAMADLCLSGAYIVTEFQNVLSIAVQRTTPNEQERPNMEEVLQKLEETHILSLNFKSNCKNFWKKKNVWKLEPAILQNMFYGFVLYISHYKIKCQQWSVLHT